MKLAALIAGAAILIGAKPIAPTTDRDFDHLITAAIRASASTAQPDTNVICVQEELEAPLTQSKAYRQAFKQSGTGERTAAAMNWQPKGLPREARTAFETALAPGAPIAPQRDITSVPPPFVLFPKATEPAQCDHSLPAPGQQPRASSSFVLSFSRPVLVHGYAFIDEAGVCAGLCGTGWLRVFKKRDGKWQQLASALLWVS